MWKQRIALGLASSLVMLGGCADAPADLESLVPRLVAEAPPQAVVAQHQPEEFRLRLHHLHTGESIDVAYRRDDVELKSGMAMLNHLLRDWRTGEDAKYPVQEFDLLHALVTKLGHPNAVIDVLCGYRSAETNRFLRAASPATGVAENSQHILSRAIDIRISGVSTKQVRDAAVSLSLGGVGYYPRSHFVHVDVGPVRQWTFGEGFRAVATRTRSRHHRA
jgi:uncharacterized protein YcbK (DUF882 family)